jgi:AraC-like DNA-binding protein
MRVFVEADCSAGFNPCDLKTMVDRMSSAPENFSQRRFYFRYLRVDAKSRKWGMYVTTCGRSTIRPEDGYYPPVQHPQLYHFDWEHGRVLDEYQMIYIPEGSGFFETKKQKIQIEGGSVILLTPGLWHRFRPNPKIGWREYWVGFAGPAFKAIFDAKFFSKPYVFRTRQSAGILDTFELLIAAAQENGPALQQNMAALTSLLLAQLYSSTFAHPATAKEASGMVQRAKEMMLSQETQDLPLEETARRLGTSYSNFRRTFREHTGVAPHQYRLHLKLSHARNLLRNSELSIKEIACQSGFEDEQYFRRFFKKTLGKTPTQYRSQ